MKAVKNETTQGFELFINTTEGQKAIWLKPKQRIILEDSAISEQLREFNKRKLIKITNA